MLTKRGEGLTRRDFIKIAGNAVDVRADLHLVKAMVDGYYFRNVPDKGGSPST